MPVVPRVTTPQTQIAEAPGGSRGSLATRSLGQTQDAFGGAIAETQQRTGQIIQNISGQLLDASIAMKNREDAVTRAKDFDVYRKSLRDEFLAVESSGDNFASTESAKAFTNKANENMERLLADHTGSASSRLVLNGMLIDERGKFTEAVVARSIKVQKDLVHTQISDYVSRQTDMASAAPEALPELLVDFESRLANYEGTLTPGELDQQRRAGQEQMLSGALESILLIGDTKKASDVLTASSAMLSPDGVRRFRNKIIAMDVAINKATAQTRAAMDTLRSLGVEPKELDERTKLAIAGIQLPSDPKAHPTFVQQVQDGIAALESAKGRSATVQEKREIFNALVLGAKQGEPEPLFGKSEKGMARQHVIDLAPGFASGQLTPYAKRTFLQAVSAITQPDPVTGQPGILSADAVTALAMGGVDSTRLNEPGYIELLLQDPGSVGLGGIPPAVQPGEITPGVPGQPGRMQPGAQGQPQQPRLTPQQGTSLEQAGREHTTQVLQREEQQRGIAQVGQAFDALTQHERQTRAASDVGGMLAPAAPEPPFTLFDAANLLTGPVSGARQAISGTAFIGEIFPADKVRQARRFMESFVHDFVTVLQNNPKYPEGEREAIRKSLDLESKFFGEPAAFQQDLIGLDEFLGVREQFARDTVERGRVSKDVRAAALNVLNAITNARRIIGVPPLMRTPQEATEAVQSGVLRPGQKFRTPDSKIKRVPRGQ